MKLITECDDVAGKYVIVRASCNVPIIDGKVVNDFRLKAMLPTISWLQQNNARVIIVSHIGREKNESLRPVCDSLRTFLPVKWGGDIFSELFFATHQLMTDGDVIMVENIRRDDRELLNDVGMARHMATFADIYVNESFDNIHRNHTSMVALPELLPHYVGFNFFAEIMNVSRAMQPVSPSLFIIGGAKFETKTPLIEAYLEKYDTIFVGGALANDIIKADGYEVGASLVSSISLTNHPMLHNKKLLRPIDVVVIRNDQMKSVLLQSIEVNDMIVDMGERTVAMLRPYIANAATILWNGPLGKYEVGGGGSTEAVAKLVAESKAFSVIGGGDTVAAVENLNLNDSFGHVSTGGGAMLTLLEKGTTPALEVLKKK
jgi:phosphoglycerate kinase